MKIIIGLVAEKESGKTTTFNLIKEQLPSAQELMLAGHLKDVCAKVLNMDLYFFESQAEKEKLLSAPIVLTLSQIQEFARRFELVMSADQIQRHVGKSLPTTRKVLQYVGTDILRAVDDDIHLKWAMKLAPESDTYVVTDIRFPNEFNFFAKEPTFLPFSIDRKKEGDVTESASHASESHIPELKKRCLAELNNNGSLENLKDQVNSMVISAANQLKLR
jgi:hypothetical protein